MGAGGCHEGGIPTFFLYKNVYTSSKKSRMLFSFKGEGM
jgi:hypothetical protein